MLGRRMTSHQMIGPCYLGSSSDGPMKIHVIRKVYYPQSNTHKYVFVFGEVSLDSTVQAALTEIYT